MPATPSMSLTMKTFTGSSLRPRRASCARGTVRNASTPSTWPIAGRSPRVAPSATLNAQPTPSGRERAEQPFGAALRDPARQREHQLGVVGAARRRSARAARASRRAIRGGIVVNRSAICVSGIAIVGRPQPSIPARRARRARRSAAAAGARDHGRDAAASRARGRRQACRRACRSSCGRACRRAVPAAGRSRGRRPSAPARASTLRTAASCAGSAWCEAHAIAISSESRSS